MQTTLFNAWRQHTASLRIALGFIALCSAAAWSQAQESAAMRAHYSGTDRDAMIRAQFANHKNQHNDLLRVGSWADWEQKPAFLTFKFFAKIEADPGTSFTLKIGNVTYTANNVTGLVVTPWMDVSLRLSEKTTVSLTGTGLRSMSNVWTAPYFMDVRAAPFLDAKDGVVGPLEMSDNPEVTGYIPQIQGFPINPLRYPVYWEDEEAYDFGCEIPDGVTTTNWTVQVQIDEQTKQRKPVECSQDVPELQSPGEAGWPAIAPGKSFDLASEPIKWSASLGRLYNGIAAGRIYYLVQGLSSNAFTPAALLFDQPFTNNTQVTVIQTNNLLRQIRAPQAVLDIPHDLTNCLELRFYLTNQVAGELNTNGVYDILDNTPFVVWRFTNASPATNLYTKWRLTEERPGWSTYTNEVEYIATNRTWLLTRGIGAEQYRETRALCLATNIDVVLDEWDNPIATNYVYSRYETNQLSDGAGRQAFVVLERYIKTNDWFWTLGSVVIDPLNSALTYSFEYCDYGVSRLNFPDGSWEERSYGQAYGAYSPIVLRQIRRSKTATLPIVIDYEYWDNPFWYVEKINFSVGGEDTYGDGFLYGGKTYRWDYTHLDPFYPTSDVMHQTYGRGGLECPGGLMRNQDLVMRYNFYASQDHLGQTAFWRSNYTVSATNTFNWGTLADNVFTECQEGEGWDWRKMTDYGAGDSGDTTGWSHYLLMLPDKSTRECEYRQGGVVTRREFSGFQSNYVEGVWFDLIFSDTYANDCLGRPTAIYRTDANSAATRTLRTADWQGAHTIPGTLLLSETDETGITKSYTYDSLKRLKTLTLAGANGLPNLTVTYTYDARDQVLSISTNAGSLTLKNLYKYDLAGRRTRGTNHFGLVTSYTYTTNSRDFKITYPGGAYLWKYFDLSGELCGQSGTAAVSAYTGTEYLAVDWLFPPGSTMNYWKNLGAYVRYQTNGEPGSLRWKATYFNMWDRPVAEAQPGVPGTDYPVVTNRSYVYLSGLLNDNVAQVDVPINDTKISTCYNYDHENNQTAEMVWTQTNRTYYENLVDYYHSSSNRLSTITSRFVRDENGVWFRYTSKSNYQVHSDYHATLVSETREQLNGLAEGVKARTITLDADANQVIQTVYVDRANRKVTTVTEHPVSTLAASNVVINGLPVSESTLSVAAPTTYGYDALRRPTQVTTPAGAVTRTAYNSLGQVSSTTDFAGNTTTYAYYPGTHLNAGRLKSVTDPTGRNTYYDYSARGEVVHTWGDVPYPEERVYNSLGEMVELRTFQGGSGWTGATWPTNSAGAASVTTWTYDPASGLLMAKNNQAAGGGTFQLYGYQEKSMQLWYRTSQERSVYYSYTDQGDLRGKSYGDGITTNVFYLDFDRVGRPCTIIDASGTRSLVYDHAGRVVLECWTDGLFSGLALSNHIDQVKGRDSLDLLVGTTNHLHHGFGYDDYGRLNAVTANGAATATYGYLPNSDRLQATAFTTGAATNLLTAREWERGERLQKIGHADHTGAVLESRQYWYDALQRRTQALLQDGSRWQYGYNERSELTQGRRYWGDGAPVTGQQFTYGYDAIGNRTNASSGGDASGANLRDSGYTVGELNEYTQVTTPGYKDVLGVTYGTNAVWINGSTNGVDRHGEYFHKELAVNNSASPLWTGVTVTNQVGTNTGGFILPKAQQSFSYDWDGNLLAEGVCSYTWDGENRLIALTMTNVAGLPNTQRKQLLFAYDEQGRRVAKIVKTWNGSAFANPVTNRFLYDGWRVIAILNPQSALLQSYAWGLDLSGSEEGAGGIGGLVCYTEHGTGANRTNHFPAFDGHGNVLALVQASDGALSARYEYGPFGEPIRATGPAAKANPFRFSTKYTDEETGLVYYGYRFYSPTLGRWLNRDPKEEEGGLNLYAFCGNDPINAFDAFGETSGNTVEVNAVGATQAQNWASTAESVIKLSNKAKEVINTIQDLEDIKDAIMAMNDPVGALIQISEIAFDMLDAKRKGKLGDDDQQHLVPQMLKKLQPHLKGEIDKFTVGLERSLHRRLHSGKGFGRGGIWNGLWVKFMGNQENNKVGREDMHRFMGQMRTLFGLDEAEVRPYHR